LIFDLLLFHALHGLLDVEEDGKVITVGHHVIKPATGSASNIEQWGATPLPIVTTLVLVCPRLAALLSTRLTALLAGVTESSVGGGGIDGRRVKYTGVVVVVVDIFDDFV